MMQLSRLPRFVTVCVNCCAMCYYDTQANMALAPSLSTLIRSQFILYHYQQTAPFCQFNGPRLGTPAVARVQSLRVSTLIATPTERWVTALRPAQDQSGAGTVRKYYAEGMLSRRDANMGVPLSPFTLQRQASSGSVRLTFPTKRLNRNPATSLFPLQLTPLLGDAVGRYT